MTLHDIAALVEILVEGWWSAACSAFVLPGCLLVGLLWDHRLDAPGSEVVTDDPVGVGLIGDHSIGSGPGPAGLQPGDPDIVDDLGEHRPVITLTGGEQNRDRHAVGIHSGVQFRGQPAAGTAYRMAFRLGIGQILVIRRSPLWAGLDAGCWCRAGEHG